MDTSPPGTGTTVPVRPVPPTPTNNRESSGRFARSGAPSVTTRVERETLDGSHGDDDEPVLMEFRNIKSQSDDRLFGRLEAPVQANVSFVSHGFTAIGDKVKQLNDTLGELQSLGIQHVTNLPELVLVGDQSAGKSSLMSSFSGIYLPRSEGACTRCPVHIRLSDSQDGSWSCRISLQQDYEFRPPAQVTRANPFGPWFEQHRNVKDFANLGDPTKIEETLRWAQIATLNPSRDHGLYKPGTGEIWRRTQRVNAGEEIHEENEAAFSPNTVALNIHAPGLADLSFYDLPGVFTSAKRDEDQYLVQVVQNLTAKYISHQQAIILWAVPMNADPETSSTFSIIRAKKAQSRTIGIMTKADLLPPDPNASAQWTAMLRGEQHRVGHGYFMTARPIVTQNLIPDAILSQRDPARPADDLERQGAFEEAFFNKQLPGLANQEWRDCFKDFEDRCGVSRLAKFMSQQLGHEFAKCLPQIKERVTTKLLDVNRELSNLPDIPENPEVEVRRSLAEFASQREILNLKPRYFVKHESSPLLNRVDINGRIDLTHDDDSTSLQSASPAPTDARRRRFAEYLDGQQDSLLPVTPSKRARGEAAVKSEAQTDYSPGSQMFRSSQTRPPAKTLQAVRDIIASKSKPGMPGIVTEDVYNSLCMEAVKPWLGPLHRLVDKVYTLLDTKLYEILYDALGNLRERLIFKMALSILKKFLVDRLDSVRRTLLAHYNLETRKFFTLDSESLARHERAEAKILARHRHHHRMVAYLGDKGADRPPPRPWEEMAEEERLREEARMNQEAVKLGPDPFKAELDVCAYVRGYYLTASTRFIDTCTLHVFSGLVPDVIDTLSKWYIDTELGVFDGTTPQSFIDLMEEDAGTSEKRNALKEDRRRFELTMESIERLENSTQCVAN
ncbi:dynamin family protein [Niveomyces insectorum RCEF 264]|uniref:Dynamin family protein n=1 Tax=Niveomyces insectorum RCEF 264 TaxID=1081102 RepID=A0A167PWK0_9HYPO|nr:dynamin family protein [Niveomyces insectorum RCEF 264]